jgi:colicin import membrane protein
MTRDVTHYSIPQEPGRWKAFALAAAVHLALFALLWVGIRWQSQTPVTLEAEVWSPQVHDVAPPPPEPPQAMRPEPTPPPVEPAKPMTPEPAIEKPDIALAQKKKRKEEEKRRLEELAQKEEEQRIADEKAAALAKKNAAREKEKAEKKRLQEQQADEKLREKAREEEMRRISGATGVAGDSAKSQSSQADPAYVQMLSARIYNNTIFVVPPDLRGNPSVEYTVELFPNGDVRNIKKEHSSNLPGFDEAVKSAIEASSPFPRDKTGNVPSRFTFSHKPKKE